MCYNGKCLHCIEVETGSLIFGIISATLTGLACTFTLGCIIYLNVMIASYGLPATITEIFETAFIANTVLGITLVFLLLPFSFSIMLIKGVVQRKHVYVKAYFIYGVFVTGVILGSVSSATFNLPGLLSVLLVCGLYSLILYMIHTTYQKIKSGEVQFGMNRLVEEKYQGP